MGNGRMTITDVAQRLGVNPKTVIRWEKSGKVNRSKRDWRGWRVYDKTDLKKLIDFKETIIYLEGDNHDEEDGNGKTL